MKAYRVYFNNGNEALFDSEELWDLIDYLSPKRYYYNRIEKIEEVITKNDSNSEVIWGLFDEATGRNYPIGDIIEVYAYLEAYKKRLFEMSIPFKDYPMIEKTYFKEDLTYPICNSIEEFLNEIFC